MNDHQQVAAYITEKMRQSTITGEEAETMASAKRWLALIASGQFVVVSLNQGEGNGKAIPAGAANGAGAGDGDGYEDPDYSPGGTA
jgi:hypothetical protein